MKKFLSIILCLTMVFAMSATAFATEADSNLQPQQVTINEYEALKQLSEVSPSVLSKAGYTSDEISKIKNYNQTYYNHITELQTLSDTALANHGYTASQIDVIKNFTGTEEQMLLASASLDIYSTTALFSYTTGGRTTGRLAYNWNWSGVPAIKMRDMVAASWNNWVLTDNSSYVSYYGVNTGTFYTTESATYTNPTNNTWNGGGHKFDMTKSDNYYYAKSGGGTFDVESDGLYQKDFYYYIEYGHATLSYSIGFSVSVPGGGAGSISFSVVTAYAGSDSGSYRW